MHKIASVAEILSTLSLSHNAELSYNIISKLLKLLVEEVSNEQMKYQQY